jgi:hypothetical protein
MNTMTLISVNQLVKDIRDNVLYRVLFVDTVGKFAFLEVFGDGMGRCTRDLTRLVPVAAC